MKFKRLVVQQNKKVIVVVLDICSSSEMVGELLQKGELHRYQALISKMKRYLADVQMNDMDFEPYKFTGDGWILLFPIPLRFDKKLCDRKTLLTFLQDFAVWFKREYARTVGKYLDTTLSQRGINFGIDAGNLSRETIFQQYEYFGRSLIIASRLQRAIKCATRSTGYKALVSYSAFSQHFKPAKGYAVDSHRFPLQNIGKVRCKLIDLKPTNRQPNVKRRIKGARLNYRTN